MFKLSKSTKLRFEQLWQLSKADYTKRYYGSSLGVLWAFLEPVFSLMIYYFAFSVLINRKQDSTFAAYLFSGLIALKFFTVITNRSIEVLRSKKYLIENIPFRRFDMFFSIAITELISLFVNISMFLVVTPFIGIYPSFYIVQLIPLLVIFIFISLGAGMILATVSVFFRDIKFVWQLSSMLLMWTSPFVIPLETFMEVVPWMVYINPIFAVVANFRNPLMYSQNLDLEFLLISIAYAATIFTMGYQGIKKYSSKIIEL